MTLSLSDSEARSFAQGERVLKRIIPVWLQPRIDNGIVYDMEANGFPMSFFLENPWHFDRHIPKPGSPVDLKETWAALGEDYRPCNPAIAAMWVYKADHITGNDGPDHIKWHSPVTMPRDAVRWYMTVVSVEVKERDGVWGWETKTEERG